MLSACKCLNNTKAHNGNEVLGIHNEVLMCLVRFSAILGQLY